MSEKDKGTFDPSQKGIHKFLNEYEELILQYVWNAGEYGVDSASTRRVESERPPKEIPCPGPQSSTTLTSWWIEASQGPGRRQGKGGHRKIYYPLLDKDGFIRQVLGNMLQSMIGDFSEETNEIINDMVQSTTQEELQECSKKLQSKNEELNLREAENKELLDFISTSISLKDTDFTFKWVNEKIADSMDLRIEDILGKKCYEIGFGRDEPCEGCLFKEAIKSRRSIHGEKVFTDGSLRDSIIDPILDGRGKVMAVIERAKRKTGD